MLSIYPLFMTTKACPANRRGRIHFPALFKKRMAACTMEYWLTHVNRHEFVGVIRLGSYFWINCFGVQSAMVHLILKINCLVWRKNITNKYSDFDIESVFYKFLHLWFYYFNCHLSITLIKSLLNKLTDYIPVVVIFFVHSVHICDGDARV